MDTAGDSTAILPDDPEALRALLVTARAKCEALTKQRDGLATERNARAARNERLQHLLGKLQRMQAASLLPSLREARIEVDLAAQPMFLDAPGA